MRLSDLYPGDATDAEEDDPGEDDDPSGEGIGMTYGNPDDERGAYTQDDQRRAFVWTGTGFAERVVA